MSNNRKMSKVDGPPAKVIKYEMESQFLEGEVTDEGHEEWLSEGILSDEDDNPASQAEHSQDVNEEQSMQAVTVEGDDSQESQSQDGDGRNPSQDGDTTGSLPDSETDEISILQAGRDNETSLPQPASDETSLPQPASDVEEPSLLRNYILSVGQTLMQEAQDNKIDSESQDNKTGDSRSSDNKFQDSGSQGSADTNIEDTLNNFENAREDSVTPDLPDDLDAYLIRRAAPPAAPAPPQRPDDDGNDTDDLLQMLGDSENKGKKKKQLTRKGHSQAKKAGPTQQPASSDDDDFVFSGKSKAVKSIQAARSALVRKPAARAEPETAGDLSESEPLLKKMPPSLRVTKVQGGGTGSQRDAAEDADSVRMTRSAQQQKEKTRVFFSTPMKTPVNKRLLSNTQQKVKNISPPQKVNNPQQKLNNPQQKPNISQQKMNNSQQKLDTVKQKAIISQPKVVVTQLKVNESPQKINTFSSQDKVVSQPKVNIISQLKAISSQHKTNNSQQKAKNSQQKVNNFQQKVNNPAKSMHNKSLLKSQPKVVVKKNDNESEESDAAHMRLLRERLSRPEGMDEDMLTDGDSGSERDSLIDELPSSESDTLDEWFTLDVRSERAGDYLPILGERAQEVLLEEKRRVETRLASLKSSLSAITNSGKKQAEELRRASVKMAELDALLQTT